MPATRRTTASTAEASDRGSPRSTQAAPRVSSIATPSAAPAALAVLAVYLFCAAYLIPIFPHGGSANELTRWATDASLVERGSFEIAWLQPLVGEIVDAAAIEGHLYSNKPPGAALLALPGYLASRPIVGAPDASNMRISWTLMRWCVSTIPMILFGYALWRRGAAPVVLTVAMFATPLFLYSLLLFSHVLAAIALFGAYRLTFAEHVGGGRDGNGHVGPTPRNALLAGVLCGVCVLSEFTTIVGVLILGVAMVLRQWPSRSKRAAASARAGASGSGTLLSSRLPAFVWFGLGGIPFAAALAFYNARLFGSPLTFSYAHESFQQWAEVAGKGVFGIGWPTPANLWLLLASPSRGLFFYSPILLLSLVSLLTISGDDAIRRKVRLAIVIAGILLLSGHGAAHGGWAAGPRYILFVVPFLIEPLVETAWFRTWPTLSGLLAGISLVLCVVPALTFPFAPHEYTFPHPTFWTPFLWQESWVTPTLGALAGLGTGWLALLPLIAALAFALIVSLYREPPRLTVGVASGVLLAAAYCAMPGLDDIDGRISRATIAERFFKPARRLDVFRPLAGDPAQFRSLESMYWMVADAWPLAPNNWPYGKDPLPKGGPTAAHRRAVDLHKLRKLDEARDLLRAARDQFPFARCDFSDQLAVVLYDSGHKDQALSELEAARPSVHANYSPGCRTVLFHLASLYAEKGRLTEAIPLFHEYLVLTEGDQTPATLNARDTTRKALEMLEGR